MNDQRRPAASRIASSTSATVATPSLTSHSASRQSASSMRSATKPSISLRTTSGAMPSEPYSSPARAIVSGSVRSPAHSSTSGNRYTGLNGCATRKRPGCAISAASAVGRSPEVDDAISTAGSAAAHTSASSDCFSSRRSGALSWTSWTPRAASAAVATTVSAPSSGSGTADSRVSARRAFSSISPSLRSDSGSGS